MFVFIYNNEQDGISIIQGTTLDKINKGIRKAIQNEEMYSDSMESGDSWEIYAIIGGKLVPHEDYAFTACHQFL